MSNFLQFNLKDANDSQLKYLKNLCIKHLKLPYGAKSLIIKNGNIITIGDLLDTSSLELFDILDKNYVLYKDTKDALQTYGIELFAHSSAKAKQIKNKYHHLPNMYTGNKEIHERNHKTINNDTFEFEM